MQFHWCVHSLGLFSAVLNPNERYTLFIFLFALISGRNLICPHLHKPFPLSACGSHTRIPQTPHFWHEGSWGLSLCHLPVAGQSSTLTSMSFIRLQNWSWCSAGCAGCAVKAAVVLGMWRQSCVHGQCCRVCVSPCSPVSPGCHEESGRATSAKVMKKQGQSQRVTMFCSCLYSTSLGLWRSLISQRKKKSLGKFPLQVVVNELYKYSPFFMLSPRRIKRINRVNRTDSLAGAVQKGLI